MVKEQKIQILLYSSSLNEKFYSGKIPEIKFSLDNVCFLFCFGKNSHQSYTNSLEGHLHMLWTTSDFTFIFRFQIVFKTATL